jgi:hypothetical protein
VHNLSLQKNHQFVLAHFEHCKRLFSNESMLTLS